MKYPELIIHTDGGSRGNPGPSALGVVVTTPDGEVVEAYGEYLGEMTNNQAEYYALLSGIRKVIALGAERLKVYMDSELIIKQMKGEYRVKNKELGKIFIKIHNELIHLKKYSFEHVRREKNKEADAQVNIALDRHV